MTVLKRWATIHFRVSKISVYSIEKALTSQQKRVPKLLPNRLLNLEVRREVDAARRLVQHHYRALPQQRTRHRKQLPLPRAEVQPARAHLRR